MCHCCLMPSKTHQGRTGSRCQDPLGRSNSPSCCEELFGTRRFEVVSFPDFALIMVLGILSGLKPPPPPPPPSPPLRSRLRFSHHSNLCLQQGCPQAPARQFICSCAACGIQDSQATFCRLILVEGRDHRHTEWIPKRKWAVV